MKVYSKSDFGYCPMVWMMHSMVWNKEINRIYEKASRFVYQDNTSMFEVLLNKDNSVEIPIECIRLKWKSPGATEKTFLKLQIQFIT